MLYINGNWQAGKGTLFHSFNPATDDILWTGKTATSQDVNEAVKSAKQALPAWKHLTLADRIRFLHAFRDQLKLNQTRLTELITAEVGKPLWDAATEVQAMIGKIDLTVQAIQHRRPDVELPIPGGHSRTTYQPLGVVTVFGPFNFPGHIANGQIVPALLAGNTVVFKPSELTPLVAEETVKLWEAAGLPPGVLNLVQGAHETGESLASHPEIRAILFTGSLQTGIALQRTLVGRPEVLLALELGGNNPLIVTNITDIKAAVYWTIQSAFLTTGQRCTCARRLIVTKGNNEFLRQLKLAIAHLEPGLPDVEPLPFLGPLIHANAVSRLLQEQDRLISGGAVSLVRAERSPVGRAFVTPAFLDVTDCDTVEDQELFGPLLQLHRVRDLGDAIAMANETQYGLVAGLFSDHADDFDEFSSSVQAGLLNWNRPTTGAGGQLPFGGWGRSGNHRPAGYFMIDSCNAPVATMESPQLQLPNQLSPGISP